LVYVLAIAGVFALYVGACVVFGWLDAVDTKRAGKRDSERKLAASKAYQALADRELKKR
jgi:hypothetical protein